MNKIQDAAGRIVEVLAGEMSDGTPVAMVTVQPLGSTDGYSARRPLVTLWLCAAQIDELTRATNVAWREAATS